MFDYVLPSELIAQRPCEPRDAARLLVLDRRTGGTTHQIFGDLPSFLRPKDCLVLNDTRVIPARLFGRRASATNRGGSASGGDTGGKVELLILRQAQDERGWVYRCLGQPGKGLKFGQKILFNHGSIQAEVISAQDQERLVRFNQPLDENLLAQLGQIPLPPYIRRPVESEDAQWYQTVFAREPGAVAAPTAGLHFTEELLERIRRMGAQVAFVTLHVGWGTFKPVGEEELKVGKLHSERFSIPAETLKAIDETKKQSGRVIAVGTTVVRTLETASGCHLEAEGREISEISRFARNDEVSGTTDLFIRPGFRFQIVDALVTNFHLPGTSLLHMVAAFAGEKETVRAYKEAIRQRYRFYSYGDAMLIA